MRLTNSRRLSTSRVQSTSADIARHTPRTATTAPAGASQGDEEPETAKPLSAVVARAVDAIRLTFSSFVDDFAAFTISGEDLAPRFMKTYRKWEAETGGSFVAFVRLLVPALPMDVKGYKAHSAYASADYLRREAARMERQGTTPVERAQAIANRPASPRVAMARLMASIMPLIAPDALAVLYDAMRTQLNWTDNQVAGLRELVGEETPLVRIRPPRGVHIDAGLKVTEAPIVNEDIAATA